MIYQGSKERFAGSLIPIIQKCISETGTDTYIELFGGGANVIDKVRCPKRIYMDANGDLVDLFNYVKSDPSVSMAPDDCSFEHYSEVRADRNHEKYTSVYRTLIGYMASYGGRFFDGGYGRDPSGRRNIYNERVENLRKQAPKLADVEFVCSDYRKLDPEEWSGVVFYLDPPYKGTKPYAPAPMDYDDFHDFCRKLSERNVVLVSEYSMPDDFECVWSKDCKVYQKADRTESGTATEKLFIHRDMWRKDILSGHRQVRPVGLF